MALHVGNRGPGHLSRVFGAAIAAGATTNLTVALKRTAKALLATGAALIALTAAPSGNTFTLTHGAGGVIEPATGALYTDNIVTVGPGAGWTGVIKTGYTVWTEDGSGRTSAPDVAGTGGLGNETRTTAKPTLQCLTVRNQRFTATKIVSFACEAPGGVTKARYYDEGSVADQSVKSWARIIDDAGRERWIFGYHFTLDQALHTAGTAEKRTIQTYCRGYPVDGTMQTQLIGTGANVATNTWHQADPLIVFHPEPTPHDCIFFVDNTLGSPIYHGGSSTATTANVPYTDDAHPIAEFPTLDGVLNWLGNVAYTFQGGAVRAPKVLIKHTGTYELVNASSNSYAYHWAAIAVANAYATYLSIVPDTGVDVTLSRAATITDQTSFTNSAWHCWWEAGMELRQTNGAVSGIYTGSITLQTDNVTDMLVAPTSGAPLTTDGPFGIGLWLNGATSGATWGFNTLLDYNNRARSGLTGLYNTYSTSRGCGPGFTMLALDSDFSESWLDLTNYCRAVYKCRFTNCGSEFVNTARNTLQVKYIGAQASGTADLTASTSASTWSFTDGVNTYTTPAIGLFANFSAVVTWINANTAGNWVAQLDPSVSANDRLTDMSPCGYSPPNFAGISCVSNGGPFVNKNVFNVVTTFADVHVDYCQFGQLSVGTNPNLSDAVSNIYHSGNILTGGWRIQTIFMDANGIDCWFGPTMFNSRNNPPVGEVKAQAAHKFSNVNFVGYCDPNIALLLANNVGGFSFDSYSHFTGCVFGQMQWGTAASAPANPVFDKCHFVGAGAGGIDPTTGAAGSNVPTNFSCGTGASVVTDIYPSLTTYAGTDFTPGGALLTQTVAKGFDVDIAGVDVPATVVKGGKVVAQTSLSLNKTQALALAGCTLYDTIGNSVDTMTLSWRHSAGNSGVLDQIVYTFNVTA